MHRGVTIGDLDEWGRFECLGLDILDVGREPRVRMDRNRRDGRSSL